MIQDKNRCKHLLLWVFLWKCLCIWLLCCICGNAEDTADSGCILSMKGMNNLVNSTDFAGNCDLMKTYFLDTSIWVLHCLMIWFSAQAISFGKKAAISGSLWAHKKDWQCVSSKTIFITVRMIPTNVMNYFTGDLLSLDQTCINNNVQMYHNFAKFLEWYQVLPSPYVQHYRAIGELSYFVRYIVWTECISFYASVVGISRWSGHNISYTVHLGCEPLSCVDPGIAF